MKKLTWDQKNMKIAELEASFSKDPSRKCGCYICTLDNRPVSLGYNGFPTQIKDTKHRLHTRNIKLGIILHAEENAMGLSPTNDLSNCKAYVWPFRPCSKCASNLIIRKVKMVIAPKFIPEKWKESCMLATELFKEAKVKLKLI